MAETSGTGCASHLILATHRGKGPRPDVDQLDGLLAGWCGNVVPDQPLADAGFDSAHNHQTLREMGIESIIPAADAAQRDAWREEYERHVQPEGLIWLDWSEGNEELWNPFGDEDEAGLGIGCASEVGDFPGAGSITTRTARRSNRRADTGTPEFSAIIALQSFSHAPHRPQHSIWR